LFAVRKTRFKDHPGVIPELDLVEENDKITHYTTLDEKLETYAETNVF
jgi:pre-mRNA-splicing factor CWC22